MPSGMKDILMSETGAAPCERCPLEAGRAVAARGPVPARLLLLSGAPRAHEERAGVAFASPAFSWLEETLAAAGLDPAGIHYATLTGCRPPHQRPVRAEEISACAPRLDIAVEAVAPEVIVLCGPEAVATMLPGVTLSTGHGRVVVRGRRRYFPIRNPYAALHCQRYVEEVVADLRRLAVLLADGPPTGDIVLDEAPTPVHAAPSTSGVGRRDVAAVAEVTPAAPVDRPPEPTEPADSEGDAAASGRGVSAPEPEDAGTPDPAGVDSPAQLSLF
jgi:uracil-DNA glycosylase family 4